MIHINTVIVLNILVTSLFILSYSVYWETQKKFPGLGYWLVGTVAIVLGYVSYLSRFVFPMEYSIVFTNLFLPLSIIWRITGVNLIVINRKIPPYIYVIPLVTIITSLFSFFNDENFLLTQSKILQGTTLILLLCSIIIIFKSVKKNNNVFLLLLGVVFTTEGLVRAVRLVYINYLPNYTADSTDVVLSVCFVGWIMSELIQNILFLLISIQNAYRKLQKTNQIYLDSEARYRSLSEASFEGIVISDGGQIIDANSQIKEMFGYEIDESFVGKTVLEFVPDSEKDIVVQKLKSGYDHPYESKGLKKDGTIFPVKFHGKTFEYRGKKARVTAVLDLTKQKKAEMKIDGLKGILPLCSKCSRIRNDKGKWENIDQYISTHSKADVSHSLCPHCMEELYPDLDL